MNIVPGIPHHGIQLCLVIVTHMSMRIWCNQWLHHHIPNWLKGKPMNIQIQYLKGQKLRGLTWCPNVFSRCSLKPVAIDPSCKVPLFDSHDLFVQRLSPNLLGMKPLAESKR